MKRYLLLVRNDDIVAAADTSGGGALKLINKLFLRYCKTDEFVSLVSLRTDENILYNPRMYHLGVIGGDANVFCCTKAVFKVLRTIPLKSYGLVSISNDALYPEDLCNFSTSETFLERTCGIRFKV